MEKSVSIIGSGFSSLSAACYFAAAGYKTDVYEKNTELGGRARQWEHQGFKFDMGPTWYWMPDVFERFFADFGRKPSDFYGLERLSPAYRVYFGEKDFVDIHNTVEKILQTFEEIETGSAQKLEKFLKKAASNYEIAVKKMVYLPGLSPLELITKDTVTELKQFFFTIRDYVHKHFKDRKLRQILEFPVLFLGAKPSDTPLFYSFMNHADFVEGTWFPDGGMHAVTTGIIRLAEELGVKFHTNSPVTEINFDENKKVKSIKTGNNTISVTTLVSGADYKHTESLLPANLRSYSEKYWAKRVLAPSSLLFYVGFSKKLKNVLHHSLFFDTSFDGHAEKIYDRPAWPEKPLFYASFPSMTDASLAPEGCEAAIFLIPLAPDLEESEEIKDNYFELIISRLEKLTGQSVRDEVMFKRSYCVQDFKDDYHSFRGNAYGLANTLLQTAFLRPGIKSKKVKNLFFTGQLTVPGPGVPPSIISGKLVADLVIKEKNRP